MQKVIDSNFLQSSDLRRYLLESPNNLALLTDYAAMEAYKGNTLKSIGRSMEIVCEFPRQVVVLRSTGIVAGLHGKRAGLQRRLIDQRQTREFGKFSRILDLARRGHFGATQHLLRLGREADDQMERIQEEAQHIPRTMKELQREFTGAEISLLRRCEPFTDELFSKIQRSILVTALSLIKQHPNTRNILPPFEELPNTFLFRAAVCMHAWFFRWMESGSPTEVAPEKTRNDVIDINFATFATFFDGILTNDKKLTAIHAEARAIISTLANAKISHAA